MVARSRAAGVGFVAGRPRFLGRNLPPLPFLSKAAWPTRRYALPFATVTALRFLVFSALPWALGGCDRPPSADSLREWTPADHHSSDDDRPGHQAAVSPPAQTAPSQSAAAGADVTQLVDITWRQQCATCHGVVGKGDGQFGPMVHPPDLTQEDWQTATPDSEIASAIKNGKGKMPKFDVPDTVVRGLVARVRAARGR